MKKRYGAVAWIAIALLLGVAGAASAGQVPESITGYAGHFHIDLANGTSWWEPGTSAKVLGGDVYDNTGSGPNFGLSSTDLLSTWGDRVTTIGQGTLDENDFTIFNSGSSAGNLLTASFTVQLYDAATLTPLGGYLTGVVNFGTGLPPGYYTFISVAGLLGLGINVNTNDVLITQQVATHTGPASRLGIVSLDPPTIGSSSNVMYISSTTIGPPGYYTVGTSNANPGYRINVELTTPTKASTWGRLKALYR